MDAQRPTLADVARRAGVSASTASLAFSGTGPVSDATRERVRAAADELNYAGPDPRARSLRRGRSGIVGVVVEERIRQAFRDPVKISILDGLSEELGEIDAALLVLADSGGTGVSVESAPMDAAVLVGCGPQLDASIATLRQRGIPVVAIEGTPTEGVLTISLDNRQASCTLAEHLRDLGHERVAVIALPLESIPERGPLTPEREAASTADTALERLAGIRQVYPQASGVVAAGSDPDEGAAAARALLDAPGTQRPTAIVAQSDLLAVGAIRAAEELGLSVPGDVSIVGFDGVQVPGLWPYELTTMVQPSVEKGRAAGRGIRLMLQGGEPEAVAFTSEFRLGNTTAAPGS
ncbi:substrate-binding domain-containing protein [Microbacterium sp. STN6]|uniref:LacI family DNA-binding transcriptional regulator n=1 Tax=Microbacterium sp. STN6 TaxID=2995588 RepID=UPI002260BF18|nr:substrate-binding domain-containing protein [Microbacterium sp. STN6]MCX7522676.1 substrate-binding domain-containing protein [Microbacterium sp. STN6]